MPSRGSLAAWGGSHTGYHDATIGLISLQTCAQYTEPRQRDRKWRKASQEVAALALRLEGTPVGVCGAGEERWLSRKRNQQA